MKRLLTLLAATALALPLFAQEEKPAAKPVRPIPAIERVVIISVDGLRPDRLLLADTPHLHALVRGGAYTFWAKTTAVSVTLPSHVSMLTGVTPQKHGIEWNADLPLSEPVWPKFPTLFEIARAAGYSTAMIAGKAKFAVLEKPGTLTFPRVPKSDDPSDEPVGSEAVKFIRKYKPDVLFVHFPFVDHAGHKFGWGSHEQLDAIEKADAQIGRVLDALDAEKLRASTLVIVTSDHGGCGLSHGPEDARSRHIPWIVTGPGVKKFADLTQDAALEVRTEDTFATAAWLLGLPLDPKLDGRPVKAVFEKPAGN